jgi:hypothetical protein
VLHRAKIMLAVAVVLGACMWVYPQLSVAASAHAAGSHKVTMTDHGNKPNGVHLSGTVSGSPFGTCPYTGHLIIPTVTENWHCKGGTVTIAVKASTGAQNNAAGSWTISYGTGKYRHVHGHGTFTGTVSSSTYHYSGSVSY